MALLDLGCTKTACREAGLDHYMQSLSFDAYKEIQYYKSININLMAAK